MGKDGIHKYQKCPHFMPFLKRIKQRRVASGAPWSPTSLGRPHLGGPPMGSFLGHQVHLEAFLEISKKVLFQKNPKSTFTIHEDIFLRPLNPKLFLCA